MNAPQNGTSLARPESLPDSWVTKIFDHMSGLYGSKFADLWGGSNIDSVRRMWAVKLAGFSDMPKAIKEALDALDDKPFPPTLPEFLSLCREAGRRYGDSKLALEHKPTPEERERAEHAAKEVKKIVAQDARDYLDWAEKPASPLAFEHVKKLAGEGDAVFVDIVKNHIENGVCSPELKLLSVWRNKQWVAL